MIAHSQSARLQGRSSVPKPVSGQFTSRLLVNLVLAFWTAVTLRRTFSVHPSSSPHATPSRHHGGPHIRCRPCSRNEVHVAPVLDPQRGQMLAVPSHTSNLDQTRARSSQPTTYSFLPGPFGLGAPAIVNHIRSLGGERERAAPHVTGKRAFRHLANSPQASGTVADFASTWITSEWRPFRNNWNGSAHWPSLPAASIPSRSVASATRRRAAPGRGRGSPDVVTLPRAPRRRATAAAGNQQDGR
jgi:hypothetical protein